LDPLADKLFVLAVLIVLVQEGLVAAWVVVVIFSRELIITILRSVGASQGRVIAAAPLGKTKTVTQMAAVTLLILQRPYPVLVPIADIAVAAAVVFTVGRGLDYLWRLRHLLVPVDTSRTRLGPGGRGDRYRGTRRRRIDQARRAHLHRRRLRDSYLVARVQVRRRPRLQPAAGRERGLADADRRGP